MVMEKLDNLKVMEFIDRSKMLDLQVSFFKQCREALDISKNFKISPSYGKVKNIVISGMGGSAVGGDILRVYLKNQLKVPITVVRDYTLPSFVNRDTLVFSDSYSGNTEETLSAYKQAQKAKAKIIAITGGGKLKKLCEKNITPHIIIPLGQPPRASLGYLFFPMLVTLTKIGLLKAQDKDINETIELLKNLSEELGPGRAIADNYAKQLAVRLYNTVPVIYGSSEQTGIVALRWRNQFNENSKTFAVSNVFPELNHNEVVGWETLINMTKNFHIMILEDKGDHPRVKKRIQITRDIIKDKAAAIESINSRGTSLLARLFSLISLGDFVSTYLAFLYDVDPTSIKAIDYLKNQLEKE
jgi:glucose/mannose-6-phosphate isomerase